MTPTQLPAARSRAALGLAVCAADGRFALQVCEDCATVQYPPRDVCGHCLSDRLPWRDVPRGGVVAAATMARVSGEQYFRDRLPWRTGTIRLDCGPSVVAHLHGACATGGRVTLDLRLDRAGRGALVAMPETAMPHLPDDHALAAFSADPRSRTVLIVDGRTATGPALADAFVKAGAAYVYLGATAPWRPGLGETVETVELDLTDAKSAEALADRIGEKVDIVVDNTSSLVQGRDPVDARSMFDVNCLGAMRLANAFGPAMQSRTDALGPSAAAFVTIISAWCLAGPAGFGAYAASQAARRALSHALRADMRPSGLRIVDVLTGPVDDERHRAIRPPKVSPAALAAAVIAALRGGREEVVVGDVAREIYTKWSANPALLQQEAVG